ncbi:hypothetical protein P3S67_002178 [Capsicum chacoense]
MADILPECLIQRILCFLSYKEEVKMSILSKTWLEASLTLPNLKFTVDHSNGNMKIVADNIMDRYRKGKIAIEKFELGTTPSRDNYVSSRVLSHIDKWLDIAIQNGVKDLVLTPGSHRLPIFTILAAKSLRELVLEYCNLMPVSLSSGVVNCNSLRKLSLLNVKLDENMHKTLLNSCPVIVSLILRYCAGLENIELLNLQKIKSVSIQKCKNQHVKIEASTLEHFSYSSFFFKGLDVFECQNLKSLELPERFSTLKSRSLKILKLRAFFGVMETDTPNLVSIEYEGCQIPELKFARESIKPKHSKILLSLDNDVNATWFGKLMKFLSNSISWSQVSIKCNTIKMNDWHPDYRVAAPQVDVLNLNIRSFRDCPAFVEAFLLSCYPRRLNLCSSIQMNKFFINRLMYMKKVSHPAYHERKHWNRKLKEIKAFDVNNKPLQLKSEKRVIRSPTERKEVYFLLDWQ